MFSPRGGSTEAGWGAEEIEQIVLRLTQNMFLPSQKEGFSVRMTVTHNFVRARECPPLPSIQYWLPFLSP